jgi:polysaccharide pyruvyl transferase WcaK-like protein
VKIVNYRQHPLSWPGENLTSLLTLALLHRFLPFGPIRNLLKKSNARLRCLAEADFVGDIRGGDSFSDIYGVNNFLRGTIPSLMAILLQKRLVLLPQTYGPYRSVISRRVAGFVIRRSACALARDKTGVEEVRQLLNPAASAGTRIQFCPDVAFSLDPVEPAQPAIDPPLQEKPDRPVVGLNLSGLLFNGGFTRNNMFGLKFNYRELVHALARRLLSATDARLLFVPHTFTQPGHVEHDLDACVEVCRALAPEFPQRLHLLTREYDPMRLKWIIGRSDFFIGSRMHACIAALSQGIPTVGIAYSKKFLGVFDSVGAGQLVVDARATESADALELICRHFQQREILRPRLAAAAKDARARLERTFAELFAAN